MQGHASAGDERSVRSIVGLTPTEAQTGCLVLAVAACCPRPSTESARSWVGGQTVLGQQACGAYTIVLSRSDVGPLGKTNQAKIY